MAQRGISDSESRFCGEVSWTDHTTKDWKITWTLKEQEEKLTVEANNNPPFKRAWGAAKKDPKLSSLKSRYCNSLVESQIKLIMAYTYDEGGFYSDLNRDCRESGSKYPIARRALRQALISLSEAQPPLPGSLYRKEPQELVHGYSRWTQREALKQFTSTSRSTNGFMGGPGSIVTIFKNPTHGADIAEFSQFPNEEEVLLIPEYGFYKVESVDESKVVLSSSDEDGGCSVL